MQESNFRQIVPRCGSQTNAFEELCCQLARRAIENSDRFTRLEGAGGDGGVECFADRFNDERTGWQAKYVFDVKSLITQATHSLETALTVHPHLTKFVLCFPFDPTGPTNRRGKSGKDKLDEWKLAQEESARKYDRVLDIEFWPAATLRSMILELDPAGGLAQFFFDETILSNEWFADHIEDSTNSAYPRYTPEITVNTEVAQWFAAFGRTDQWKESLLTEYRALKKPLEKVERAVRSSSADPARPKWPDDQQAPACEVVELVERALEDSQRIVHYCDQELYGSSVTNLQEAERKLAELCEGLASDIDHRYGEGRSDSPGFRQFMAEYQVSFPAANLDAARELRDAVQRVRDWLEGACGYLAFESEMILSGEWGTGKTHIVCDIARGRIASGYPTCLIFGHRFGGEPEAWERLSSTLGLPRTLSRDGVLSALNSAAEASGRPLLVVIDAINETRPLRYWHDHLRTLSEAIRHWPWLRLCATCRTPYLKYCVPAAHQARIVEHPGFRGVEHLAAREYFNHYGLKPPVHPILQPEFGNPLFLRLLCETLARLGGEELPHYWSTPAGVLAAFLQARETEFSRDKNVSANAGVVTASLRAIALAMARTGQTTVSWSEAAGCVRAARPEVADAGVIEWLVGANLLIEEAPSGTGLDSMEGSVRPAFERFGDFLVAWELLADESKDIQVALSPEGDLYEWVNSVDVIERNYGIVEALAILIAEREKLEFVDLVPSDPDLQLLAMEITVRSIHSRDPGSYTARTQNLLLGALSNESISEDATDSILAASWRPSSLDVFWFHSVLIQLPIAKRDSYWCWYLHRSYENDGPVRRLIDAAVEAPVDQVKLSVAKRWALTLSWFAAAADRRVKDWAARSLVLILLAEPDAIDTLVDHLMESNDDEVRERGLLSVYGALVVRKDAGRTAKVAQKLLEMVSAESSDLQNALIRDHIRSIAELAQHLGTLPAESDALAPTKAFPSGWPLAVPNDSEIKSLAPKVGFDPDEFKSDFFKYSMRPLEAWEHAVSKKQMGAWILQRIARGLGYVGSGCEQYDQYMVAAYGPGRSKPVWAERIGKKYQWIGMNELASRLHDHAEARRHPWDPEPSGTPLILLEGRKFDPSLVQKKVEDKGRQWWIRSTADLDPEEALTDKEWVEREGDTPSLHELLSPIEFDNLTWRALVAFPEWKQKKDCGDEFSPYRHVWVQLKSYLVNADEFEAAYEWLNGKNFFGQWMPEGASWLHGFLGEYPWGTAFNTESEEYHGRNIRCAAVQYEFRPTWNEIAAEWGYDASMPENRHVLVPAREIFGAVDLWWDGGDAYRRLAQAGGFRDPSLWHPGGRALLADSSSLADCMQNLGMRVIWTLLGEKWVVDMHSRSRPGRIFSQVAAIEPDGSLRVGNRISVDDSVEDQ